MARSLQKVIIRGIDGKVQAGFADRNEMSAKVEILDEKASAKQVPLESVKAIFFVKDFSGDPDYEDVRFLNKQKGSPAVWVRAEFADGETIEGRVQNNLDLITAPGFFLWPSDCDTNNECAYVSKAALVSFCILTAD